MMESSRFLAVDLGAESGRGVLGTLRSGRLEIQELHRFPNVPVRLLGTLHWDALRLFGDVKQCLAAAAANSAGAPESVGVDTWGVDFGLLAGDGSLVGNPVHYRDARTDGMLEEAFRHVPRHEIFRETGIQFMQLNTLYQLLALEVARSALLRVSETLLMMPDLLNYWLTGESVCEFTIASTTQMLDPRKRTWAGSLLLALGLHDEILPDIVPPAIDLGPLHHAVVEETRLSARVVAVGSHDTASAVAAVPMEVPDAAYISSGTWSLMGVETREPIITDASLRYNFTNEGGVEGTFRFLRNIMGLWLVQECRRAWARQGRDFSYDELARLAGEAPPLRSLVDPDDASFFAPADMPEAICAACRRAGRPVPEGPGQVVRCALESLAMKYRWVLARLEEMLGRRVPAIHVVGGGTQNRLLCQLTADATARPVIAGPVEATAIGNLLVQAISLDRMADLAEARAVVRNSFPTERYEPRDTEAWDHAWESWSARFE